MAITFDTLGTPQRGTGTTISLPRVGSVGDLIIIVLAVEGVLASSGPWVAPYTGSPHSDTDIGPASGWKQACWQAPSVDGGCGLEVWIAITSVPGGSGTSTLQLVSSKSYVCQQFYYTGAYAPDNSILDGAERAATTAAVNGDNPAAPGVYSYVTELLFACAADTLASPGYGTPTPPGWTTRDDQARSGFGTVELVGADKTTTVEGDTGAIPWAAAGAGGAHGAAATLAIRETLPGTSSPLIAVEFAVAN